MDDPPAILDELQAICDAATNEPWGPPRHGEARGNRQIVDIHEGIIGLIDEPYDRAFVATARTALPSTLECLRRFIDIAGPDFDEDVLDYILAPLITTGDQT
jgi:hypothetical protein